MNQSGRSEALDVLRAIAVMLVLVEHAPFTFNGIAGWTGVDLFFVLSGFLVSGLLFTEHKRFGTISVSRFLVRRGLKIYPAFYAMMLATIAVRLGRHHPPALGKWLAEIGFVQNYATRLWVHTWSLAVEEHFYFFLVVCLVTMSKWRRPDPFKPVLPLFAAIAASVLVARVVAVEQLAVPLDRVFEQTHFRIDSLMCGVALSYVFHYRPHRIRAIMVSRSRRRMVGVASAACLAPVLIALPRTPLVATIGFTLLYVGYAGLVVLALSRAPAATNIPGRRTLTSALAFIGRHSYSIYIWHIPALSWIFSPVVGKWIQLRGGFWPTVPAFVAFSVLIGIGMARVIETPVLLLRDRWFPSRLTTLAPRTLEASAA